MPQPCDLAMAVCRNPFTGFRLLKQTGKLGLCKGTADRVLVEGVDDSSMMGYVPVCHSQREGWGRVYQFAMLLP